jgi:hypothetical protein
MLRSERALTRHGGSLSNYWCYNPGALERAKLYKAEHPICGRSKGEHEARVIHPIVYRLADLIAQFHYTCW